MSLSFLENIPEIANYAEAELLSRGFSGDSWHFELRQAKRALDLIRKVNHPNVKINYDTGNSLYFADTSPYEVMEALPEVAHIHLKDKIGGKGVWNFPPIGSR